MPRDIPGGLVTQIDADQRRPVILLELGLSTTIRFAVSRNNIVFDGNTYTAKKVTFGSIGRSMGGTVGRVTLKFDNVAKDMAAYANAIDFEGKSITIKRIFLDDYDSATDYVGLFEGTLERPSSIDQQWLTVTAISGKDLSRNALTRRYQKLCSLTFGGSLCNQDSLADLSSLTATGTADSGSTTTLVDNALTEEADYWNYGDIKITISGIPYHRIVKDFDAANDEITWDVGLPVAVSSGDTYTVYKGCKKNWDTCLGNSTFGPSADNSANYGGFLHIGEIAGPSQRPWGRREPRHTGDKSDRRVRK